VGKESKRAQSSPKGRDQSTTTTVLKRRSVGSYGGPKGGHDYGLVLGANSLRFGMARTPRSEKGDKHEEQSAYIAARRKDVATAGRENRQSPARRRGGGGRGKVRLRKMS